MSVQTTLQIPMAGRLLGWLASCPSLAEAELSLGLDPLAAGEIGLTLYLGQAAPLVQRDILGNGRGAFPFRILYRLQPGCSTACRLEALALLDALAAWAVDHPPTLGGAVENPAIAITARGLPTDRHDNGDEDYQLSMTLYFEVKSS